MKYLAMVLCTAVLAVLSYSAHAQNRPGCAPRAAIIKRLADTYAESVHSTALARTGAVLEVFTSQGGKTWTMLVTFPNGQSCVMGTGRAWQDHQPKKEGVSL